MNHKTFWVLATFFACLMLSSNTAYAASEDAALDPSTWNFWNNGVFDTITDFFNAASRRAMKNLMPYAWYLITIFGIINIATTYMLYNGQMRISEIIGKVIKIGAFMFLVLHMKDICAAILMSFQYAGIIASGMSTSTGGSFDLNTIDTAKLFQPSHMVDHGFNVTKDLFSASLNHGVLFHPLDFITSLIVIGLVLVGTLLITVQIALTQIEFSIFAGLGILLLPFGLFKYTNFLAQRTISGTFSYGIKMMVVYFMVGLITTIFDHYKEAITPGGKEMSQLDFSTLLHFGIAYFVIGYIIWKIPNIVQGMMSGSPSLEGNSAFGGLMGMATGAAMGAANMYGSIRATSAMAKEAMLEKNGYGGVGVGDTLAASAASAPGGGGGGMPTGGSSSARSDMSWAGPQSTDMGGMAQTASGTSIPNTANRSSYLDSLADRRQELYSRSQALKRPEQNKGSTAEERAQALIGAKMEKLTEKFKSGTASKSETLQYAAGKAVLSATRSWNRGRLGYMKEFAKKGTGQLISNIPIVNAARAGANQSMAHRQNYRRMASGTWHVNMEPIRNDYRPDVDQNN